MTRITSPPALLLVATLIVVGDFARSSSTPIVSPVKDLRPSKALKVTPKVNSVALALQQEKYQFGAIGCNFSDSVCDLNLEYCFNDLAFGKCVSLLDKSPSQESYKFNLRRDDVRLLEAAMEELFEKGYRWSHSYTQCVLQNLLEAIRERVTPGTFNCVEDAREDGVKGQVDIDPETLAFLSTEQQIPDSPTTHHAGRDGIPASLTVENPSLKQNQVHESPITAKQLGKTLDEAILEDLFSEYGSPQYDYEVDDDGVGGDLYENPDWTEGAPETTSFKKFANSAPESNFLQTKIFGSSYNTPDGFRHGVETRDDLAFLNESPQLTSDPEQDSGNWNDAAEPLELELNNQELATVALMMAEIQKEAKEQALEDQLASEVEAALADRRPSEGRRENRDLFVEVPEPQDQNSVYSEGGLVFLKNPKRFLYERSPNSPLEDDQEFDLEFRDRDDLRPSEFERRERLDVKKPGPWYRTVNNYAFDKRQAERLQSEHRMLNPEFAGLGPADMKIRDTSSQQEKTKLGKGSLKMIPAPSNSDEVNQLVNLMKKAGSTAEASKLAKQVPGNPLEVIDTSFVSIKLGKNIPSWQVAADLVNLIADFLDLKHSTFQFVRLHDNNVITFKVASNRQGITATQVAKQIETLKPNLDREMDISIVSAVAGVKANEVMKGKGHDELDEKDAADDGGASPDFPETEPLLLEDEIHNKNLYLGVFAVCGIVAAALVASFLFFVFRKTAKSREKLAKLSQDDPAMESCKDYQDLCRARMASKSNEKVEPIRAVQRVQSNVSEGGTSSSRSSTSSWSEEPVLTNMDISTGHMVLSYMEDHLKKKDRLDQEWAALCTYEADPGSTSIAEKAENQKKNRYTNSLPYDHSRVILNDLANIAGADYINASTITDHDPRNPAYIATQGPLPNTAADFWQMVWEQGSVVIVTLTKLAENGTPLCHRYWPEEGSELHHIYEVHLVSEHIWCEEYLVRSFYLKNLKTGETRTVTQFHFLAWPENGIPTSAKSLLEFRRKVNKSYRGRSCPIIVHCSDGAGRTGTYALIDMVLNRMTKGAKEIDIAASLEHIRDQRPGMVRTKQQFEFVLMAVAEEVHAILKALPQ